MVFTDWKQCFNSIFIYVNMNKFCKINAIVNLGWSAKYKRWLTFKGTNSTTFHSKQLCNLISFYLNAFILSNLSSLTLSNHQTIIKLGNIDQSGQSYVIVAYLLYKQKKHLENSKQFVVYSHTPSHQSFCHTADSKRTLAMKTIWYILHEVSVSSLFLTFIAKFNNIRQRALY